MDKKESLNKRAFKAGVWYIVCNFLVRGINFISTPFFTRLLSKGEYGDFANFSSWLSLLTILTTLELFTSISRAKFDYKENLDEYILSIQSLGTVITLSCYVIVCFFSDFFVNLFGMNMVYINIMFLCMLVSPSFTMIQAKHRQFLKYKRVGALSMLSTLISLVVSFVFVISMKDKFFARVIGSSGVLFLVYTCIYIYNIYKGKRINIKYWRYCLPISIPLVFHVLSNNILGTSDRILIKNLCGSNETALYSVIYSCSQIIMMLFSSINQAWSPWFYEKLNKKNYKDIRVFTKMYLFICMTITCFLMLIGPEIVLFFGGKSYIESTSIAPCIMLGCFYWVLYTFFVNTEIFYKKTFSISIRTMIGAIINIIGNLILIPRFGWEAAAYTTLIGYYFLFIMHSFAGKKLGTDKYFDQKYFYLISVIMFVLMIIIRISYEYTIVRLNLIIFICILILGILYKKKKYIFKQLF